MQSIISWATALSRRRAQSLAAAMLAAVVTVDAATGRHVSMTGFYLLPLAFISWTLGMRLGVLTGLAASIVMVLLNGFGDGLSVAATTIPLPAAAWNGSMRVFVVMIVVVLVSSFRQSFDREREQARTDPLTGLLNKRAFFVGADAALARAARKGEVVLLAYLDLDGFKRVNDVRGHSAGDDLLRGFAGAVTAGSRRYDLSARIGGDEFVMLLCFGDRDQACAAAERLHSGLRTSLRATDAGVSCSMGAVVIARPLAEYGPELVALADTLMYEVKRAGKDALRLACIDGFGPAASDRASGGDAVANGRWVRARPSLRAA